MRMHAMLCRPNDALAESDNIVVLQQTLRLPVLVFQAEHEVMPPSQVQILLKAMSPSVRHRV